MEKTPIHSGIHLELHLYSKLSEEESKDDEQFSMNYLLKYGGRETIWTENCATTLHKSQQIIIEYMLAHADQTIELQVTATSTET